MPAAALAAASMAAGLSGSLSAQQVADTAYAPEIGEPTWPEGRGPRVLVDGGHHNFHTLDGRYTAFGRLLRRDGYRVVSHDGPFTAAALAEADVLVISNALAARNEEEWYLPTPSAFDGDEIAAVRSWVVGGGALLLIADHMPFPGAAADLAAAFGFLFQNGFAMDPQSGDGSFVFRRSDGSLADHGVTGGGLGPRVDSVAAFTGQAFRLQPEAAAVPLMVVPESTVLLLPEEAWVFSRDRTPRVPAAGWLQGALAERGRGRLAVFGEAAMFTAQLSGSDRSPMGMNRPEASGNHRFLLNVLRWLSRYDDGGGERR